MIRGPPCRLRIDPAQLQFIEIKLVDKDINHANRIVLVDPVIQAFGKKRRLPAIHPLNETLHPIPRKPQQNHIMRGPFHTAWTPSRPPGYGAICLV